LVNSLQGVNTFLAYQYSTWLPLTKDSSFVTIDTPFVDQDAIVKIFV